MTDPKFTNFMNGFTAAGQLMQRAAKNGYFIEYLCLAAAVIDGSLRIGLILQHQLDTASSIILDDLLFQSEADKVISEREIYRRAHERKVITDDLFSRLEELYQKRNRVVHRYVISDLTTADVLRIATEFERIVPQVNSAVVRIEELQVERGIGITREGNLPGLNRRLDDMSAAKHGSRWLHEEIKRGGT